MSTENPRRQNLIVLTFLFTYVALRFIWTGILDSLHDYASYLFEVVFVGATLALVPSMEKKSSSPARRLIIDFSVCAVVGLGIFKLAGFLGLPIPFDLKNTTNLILLLLVGPILEELLFRSALWRLLNSLIKSGPTLLGSTSLLFSFSHFLAWFRVPAELQPFIMFQTGYTLLLGIYCGIRRRQTSGLVAPMICHFGFNLGFYLGSF